MQNLYERRSIAVPIIIGINLIVFWMWNSNGTSTAFMIDNFTISWTGLTLGHYWTLLTSVFSHNWIWHLAINMFVLYSFGGFLEKVLGTAAFVRFYLVAGILSSLCHSVVSNYFLHQPDLPALGASGAIAGLVLVFALLFPSQKIYLMAILPLPALIGALAFVGLDLWGLMAQHGGGGLPIGHGAHLGGAATGALYYFLFLRKRFRGRVMD